MHNNLLEQIKAFAGNDFFKENGINYIKIKNEIVKIPDIPENFVSNDKLDELIDSFYKSAYFLK